MTQVKCHTCEQVLGVTHMVGFDPTILPPMMRGIAGLVPKDTNIPRVLLDALAIQCVTCMEKRNV